MSRAALWHDVECGAYGADLGLWSELAAQARGAVLELGCGTGRVALELARHGAEVTGVDRERGLVEVLRARARDQGLDVEALVGDVRDLALGREFVLALAPMQLAHLLGGSAGRRAMLRTARAHLSVGGRLAAALLAESTEPSERAPSVDDPAPGPLPDVREHAGWVYSSLPIAVERRNGVLEVRRLRQAVSPRGRLSEELATTELELVSPAQLEAEGAAEGFVAEDRLDVLATDDHVGSTVVVLRSR